jgi:hypothetical protein
MKRKPKEKVGAAMLSSPIREGTWCWFCGKTDGPGYVLNSDQHLICGQQAKICETCLGLCAKTLADLKFAHAINSGSANVTRFIRRAKRHRPAMPPQSCAQ